MKLQNHRFAIVLVSLGLLIGSAIAGYFSFLAPRAKPLDLTAIQQLLKTETSPAHNETVPPAADHGKTVATPASTPTPPHVPHPETTPQPPADKSPVLELATTKPKVTDSKAEFAAKQVNFRSVLSPSKLAPNMFAFATLPYDAPMAEFPLVLVWQRNLEWTKTVIGDKGGAAFSPPPSSPSGNIYGKPPKPTPPPNPPPGPPPGPPGPPPGPPPEVSYSGL